MIPDPVPAVAPMMPSGVPDGLRRLSATLDAQGYAFVPGMAMQALLLRHGRLDDWPRFAASWQQLPLDRHMADHGRYRRRRHAVYAVDGRAIERRPHQPHYQALHYNPLNGGIERWFEPIDAALGDGASLRTILACCRELFGGCAGGLPAGGWHVEVHQFRIEALPGSPGLPTPEGMHRDGVDHVLVLLVQRCNIASGTTLIGTPDGGFGSSFTLAAAFDAALVDDRRVHHGVTPVEALDPALPAWRDVLVVTFRRME